MLPMIPALAVNVPVADPLMFRLTGTGNSPVLLLRFTIAVPAGTPVNVTVQVVVCPDPSAPGTQFIEDTCTGATRLSVKLCDWPPPVAVISAD